MSSSIVIQNSVVNSRSWLSTSGKVHDNSNDSPLYSGSTEENYSREEQQTRLKNFAKKSGYTNDVTEPLLQEFNQSLNLPTEEVALKKFVETAKELEAATGKMYRSPLDEIAQQFNSSEKIEKNQNVRLKYKHIVIDGSNLAMNHGGKKFFSCRGIQICVQYFLNRGHKEITAFVPEWRKEAPKPDAPICEQEILTQLESQGCLVFTPSRRVRGKRRAHHDDYFVVKLAAEKDGIIVSNDNFRDIQHESPKWRKVIEKQLLMYSFVGDTFMPVEDPLGRHGPTLDMFLCSGVESDTEATICPYGRRCTYGNKCKYVHPEKLREDHAEPTIRQESYSSYPDGLGSGNFAKSIKDFGSLSSQPIVAREFNPASASKFNNGWDYKDGSNQHFSNYSNRREDYMRQNMNYPSYQSNGDSHRLQLARNDYNNRMYSDSNISSGAFSHNKNTDILLRGWSHGDQMMEASRPVNDFRMQSHALPVESRLQTLSISNERSFDHRGPRGYNQSVGQLQPIQRPQPRPQQRMGSDLLNWPGSRAPPRQHNANYFDRAV